MLSESDPVFFILPYNRRGLNLVVRNASNFLRGRLRRAASGVAQAPLRARIDFRPRDAIIMADHKSPEQSRRSRWRRTHARRSSSERASAPPRGEGGALPRWQSV